MTEAMSTSDFPVLTPQETPEEKIARLEATLANIEANHAEIVAEIQANLQLAQEEIQRLNNMVARIPELEQAASQVSSLTAQVSDMTQERDRLRNLLLGVVPSMEEFSVDYPAATIARTAFVGDTPEEVAEKMALWDGARQQKVSEWNSLVNTVRTQATV